MARKKECIGTLNAKTTKPLTLSCSVAMKPSVGWQKEHPHPTMWKQTFAFLYYCLLDEEQKLKTGCKIHLEAV